MSAQRFFSTDYEAARAAFLAACRTANVAVATFENPHARAPGGGRLFADVAWAGAPDAPNVVVTVSGTHGVEGFYGSGCQTGWLLEDRLKTLAADTAVMHIHAVNPFGFAWLHRTTEGNIDLNRNFIDHSRPPDNPSYADVHRFLLPDQWTAGTAKDVQAAMAAYVEAHGQAAFNKAVMGGQHTHPDGLFYGGRAPTWSNDLVSALARERLGAARRIAVLDLHTGLGPFAGAELICRHPPSSEALARARRWYGPSVTAAQAGQSGSPPVDGNLRMVFVRLCPDAEVTSIGIEVGTVPLYPCLAALSADNWLMAKGMPDGPLRDRISRDMRDAFFPDEARWTEPVYARTMHIIDQALAGLRQ